MSTFVKHTQAFWDQLAEVYQRETHISCEDFHFGPLIPGNAQLQLLPFKLEGMKCLELGAGAAQNSVFLARHGADCTAVDLSRNQLDFAEKLARKHHVELTLLQGDIQSFTTEERFDLVHSCHALQFVENQQKALKQMCGLLKPGGVLVLSTVHPLAGGEWVELEDEDGLLVKDYFKPGDDCREGTKGAKAHSRPLPVEVLVETLLASGMALDHLQSPPCTIRRRQTAGIPYWSEDWLDHADELRKIPYTVICIAHRSF